MDDKKYLKEKTLQFCLFSPLKKTFLINVDWYLDLTGQEYCEKSERLVGYINKYLNLNNKILGLLVHFNEEICYSLFWNQILIQWSQRLVDCSNFLPAAGAGGLAHIDLVSVIQ